MMEAALVKVRGNLLAPADPDAEKLLASVKLGGGLLVKAKKTRNLKFHRKFFTLLRLAFDIWDPPERMHKGKPIQKDFEKFRDEVLILAGHYDAVWRLDGTFKLEARSISFLSCDEYQFVEVYRGVLRVVWDEILRHAHFRDEAEIEAIVAELMAYE